MAADKPDYLAFFSRVVPDIRVGAGAERTGRCPLHTDARPSFSFNVETGLWNCHAGCGGGHASGLAKLLGLSDDEIAALKGQKLNKKIEVTYDYLDEHGQLLYQAIRYKPKNFSQRRPDGKGGWIWNLKDTRLVLYRLPELLEALKRGDPVFVAEGEKDVDNLRARGLTATCNPMGAGKWRSQFSEALTGATVVILPDNDDAGRAHAQQVACSLFGKAKSIKIVELPGLPKKGDVSDWLGTDRP